MNKRIVIVGAVMALLMMVSIQIVFLNIVKSDDPTQHTGNAEVGKFWVSELDVSSELTTIDYIGITHANATDDWVLWEAAMGFITVDWEVEIGSNHPEYHVIFSLYVINVDDNNAEMGNDTFETTYGINNTVDAGGTLSVFLRFTPEQREQDNQTLVCSLGAVVEIKNTTEAVNFTCIAEDRSVVAVEFRDSLETPPPFSMFEDEANDKFPGMWSWIDGWENKFIDEDDMLNHQTFFQVGLNTTPPAGGGDTIWYLGELSLDIHDKNWIDHSFTPDEYIVDWSYNWGGPPHDWIIGVCWLNYTIDPMPSGNPIIGMKYTMHLTETDPEFIATRPDVCKLLWKYNWVDDEGEIKGIIEAENVRDADQDSYIDCRLHVWYNVNGRHRYGWVNDNYQIHIVANGGNTVPESREIYRWEEKCAYTNSSSINPWGSSGGGITTISVDISSLFDASNEVIYSFAGDADDVHVEFTC